MEAKRFDEYGKSGCSFYGKLVVVSYQDDMQQDPRWGTFNAGLTFDYIEKAKKLIDEKGYNVVRVLLSIPDYVVEIK